MVKVFPSKKTRVLEDTSRISGQQILSLFDIHKWQVVYEGQTVCLFGKMIYDVENDSFNFNELIGLYRGDKQQDMANSFKTDRFLDVISIFKWAALLLAGVYCTYKIGSWAYREIRL